MSTYHHEAFGIFSDRAEMVDTLKTKYPQRAIGWRILAHLIASIWPTSGVLKFIEACREIGRD